MYSGKLKRPKFFLLRRVVGKSMAPRLRPGRLVLASPLVKRLRPGQVIILEQGGKEKIKRIERVDPVEEKLFVIGDNLSLSNDSRHFGWIKTNQVRGRVLWPRLHN